MSGLALLLLLQARAPLGTFDGWGAFRDPSPLRCFAIARPVEKHANAQPFASVATWPRDGVRNQLHIRLSRARAPDARVTLSIGERRFELQAGDADAWAPDARTDAAIVAAMRAGRSMSVETMGANGAPFADGYALRGAATAIDAAALGCAGRQSGLRVSDTISAIPISRRHPRAGGGNVGKRGDAGEE